MSALPSIVRGMPHEAYRAASGLNFSLAKWLLVSPSHFQAALKTEREETMAMRLGTCVDEYVLRGKVPEYVLKPDGMSFASTVGKAWRSAQTLPILTQEQADTEVRMCNALADSPSAQRIFQACPERQVAIFATYRGVPIKALVDLGCLNPETPALADLKTARDASPRGWGRAVAEYRYLMQSGWYRTAAKIAVGLADPSPWAWIVAESSPAAPVCVYRPTEAQLEIGQIQMEWCIDLYLKCMESGKWPAYGEGELKFDLPRWGEMLPGNAAVEPTEGDAP